VLEVGPPCGEFFLDLEAAKKLSRPLVFLSGGVGITPLLAMFAAAEEAGLGRDIYFIHGAVNGSAHALSDEVRAIAQQHGRTTVHFRYSAATDDDRAQQRCDSEGLIDTAMIESLLPGLDADYYLCGPAAFMTGLYGGLLRAGVNEDRLNVEFFGPKQDPAAQPAPADA